MDTQKLAKNAAAIVAPGKGILAADESTGTIKKRFDSIVRNIAKDLRVSQSLRCQRERTGRGGLGHRNAEEFMLSC